MFPLCDAARPRLFELFETAGFGVIAAFERFVLVSCDHTSVFSEKINMYYSAEGSVSIIYYHHQATLLSQIKKDGRQAEISTGTPAPVSGTCELQSEP